MSSTVHSITADELFNMPAGHERRELVKGELRTMAPSGFEHGTVVMKLARLLANYIEEHKLGLVLGAETGFRLSRNPDTVRGADVSFVAVSRIPASGPPVGFFEGAPDLAVEVVSPTDTAEEVEEKIDQYLAAGSRLVWVIYPRRRTVAVHRQGSTSTV